MTPTELRERLIEGMARASNPTGWAWYECRNEGRAEEHPAGPTFYANQMKCSGAALDIGLAVLDAAGWKLVPKTATEAMVDAVWAFDTIGQTRERQPCMPLNSWCTADYIAMYSVFLAAAPSPFTAKEGAE